MIGNAAHRRTRTGGQSKLKLPGHVLCVLEEHLVEIPQPEEQYIIAVLLLDVKILFQHRGQLIRFLRHFPHLPVNLPCDLAAAAAGRAASGAAA